MNFKVFIEDQIAKSKDNPEQELPSDSVIRFENGSNKYSVTFTAGGGISITKIGGRPEHGEAHGDQLRIIPKCSNEIIIK